MRAAIITRPGGPEVMAIQEVDTPVPVGEEVRVRVRASGLNRAELLQRMGHYPAPPGAPEHIAGMEFAGEVESVGAQVRSWRPGQRVMGLVGGGAQAEYVVIHEGLLVEIPANLDYVQAAGVPEVFMTAHDALFVQAGLRMGERVLIHAAGSGVGTAAIQLAKAAGATVYGTARTPAKLERARELGLEAAFGPEHFAEEICTLTGGQGVHVVLDFIGGAYLEQNLYALAPWGRMVTLATLGGIQGSLNFGLLMSKRLTLKGVTLRSRSLGEKLAATSAYASAVLPLLASGQVRPIIERVFPLEEIADAHRMMENNENYGKIILEIA